MTFDSVHKILFALFGIVSALLVVERTRRIHSDEKNMDSKNTRLDEDQRRNDALINDVKLPEKPEIKDVSQKDLTDYLEKEYGKKDE